MSSGKCLTLILLLAGWLTGASGFKFDASAYCDLPYCGANNVVCLKTNYSFECRPMAKFVKLKHYKTEILGAINGFRNKAAIGLTRYLLPAGRMARMDWSDELEYFARADLMTCMPLPRPCMTSPNIPNVGSIFDTDGYPGKEKKNQEVVLNIMSKWFDEGQYVTKEQLMYLEERKDSRSTYRPVLLMTDRNTLVGCSALKFTEDRNNYFYLSCCFSTVGMKHTAIYQIALSAGSLCKRRDIQFKNLCALGEKYPDNMKIYSDQYMR
ncbi:allergen Tab y 5.0101-like [Drosophila subobscura]|uniref:allergen Tab y 5.0101-like n=1 Tax=Drosophila subobscura TaxID=7241 RepID=UPI00155B26E8|nr:allergen Tab y 5.0101-like [Drosophila subobscura]